MPNYSVIIDTRDRLIPQLAYVVEENIELGEGRVSFFFPLFISNDVFTARLVLDSVDGLRMLFQRSTNEEQKLPTSMTSLLGMIYRMVRSVHLFTILLGKRMSRETYPVHE